MILARPEENWKHVMSIGVSVAQLLGVISLTEAGRLQTSIRLPIDEKRMDEDTARRLKKGR